MCLTADTPQKHKRISADEREYIVESLADSGVNSEVVSRWANAIASADANLTSENLRFILNSEAREQSANSEFPFSLQTSRD